ncbi:MAG: hypothetical protein KIT25_10190 [Enhydrobacter sp.]|nr:MAG: hypothetical protein KIT25_10190 [Enhydrobacter sp.]
MFSDYSGQHQGATHEAYSFLVATQDQIVEWLPLRQRFRDQWLPDRRRISFKQLREPMRRRAFPHFLNLVGQLPANLITIMISQHVGSFVVGGPAALARELNDCFVPGTPNHTVEKIYRLALFVATLNAGLREEAQRSLWISDHDETLDTFEKRECFGRLATYLTFGLTGWRNAADHGFVTTAASGLPEWVEDVAAIPDIAAGASARLCDLLPVFMGRPTWTVPISQFDKVDWRARLFGDWLSARESELRHVLVRLERDSLGMVRASAQQFVRRASDG